MKCSTCNGSGKVSNPNAGSCESPWENCPSCGGSGQIGVTAAFDVIDVIPTMTVNNLLKIIHGEDRNKQLIVLDTKTGEWVDVTAAETNEDNVCLVVNQ